MGRASELYSGFEVNSTGPAMPFRTLVRGAIGKIVRRYPLARRLLGPVVRFYRGGAGSLTSGIDERYFQIERPAPRGVILLKQGVFIISGWAVDVRAGVPIKVKLQIGRRVYHPYSKIRLDIQQSVLGAWPNVDFHSLSKLASASTVCE